MVKRLDTYYGQKTSANHFCHAVHSPSCMELFATLLLKRDGKFQHCFHAVHRSEFEWQNLGNLFKSSLNPVLGLIDGNKVF